MKGLKEVSGLVSVYSGMALDRFYYIIKYDAL